MALLIQLALTHRPSRMAIVESSLTMREGKYVSWFVDSKFASDTAEGCVGKVMEALDTLEHALESSHCLIATFGTPDVWLLKDTDRLVGNCHKHSTAEFEKRRLSIGEIAETWTALINGIRMRNPDLKVVFTVSPRRYLEKGFADGSRLKARLLLAAEQLCESLPDSFYFPAYEIMTDDLRDYRFYDRDMLHPSPVAVDYIWEKFKETFLDEEERRNVEDGEKANRRNLHRSIL